MKLFMKSKLCWMPFIPIALAVAVAKILQVMSVSDLVSSVLFSYLIVAAVLILFLINIVFVAMDKETSPIYILSKNIPASICVLVTAVLVASKSSLTVIVNLQNGVFGLFDFVLCLFGIMAAISLVVIAFAHFQGRNFMPGMGVFLLCITVWACLMLIGEFMNNRTVSVMSIDPMTLFCYAFLMIYSFKNSMVISAIDGKNPVKAMYLYGLPLAALGFAMGGRTIASAAVNGLDYSEDVLGVAFLFMALYIVFFNYELTKKARTKKEQVVKFDLEDVEEQQIVYGLADDDYIVASNGDNQQDYDYPQVNQDTDFVIGTDYDSEPESPVSYEAYEHTAPAPDKETEAEAQPRQEENEQYPAVQPSQTVEEDTPPDSDEAQRMEKIDRIISDFDIT